MSALSACCQPASDVAQNWGGFYMECTGQENDFELILTVKMETRYPLDGYFGSEFLAICNHCGDD